jgi:DNA-binding CsgD family transcriptional regulator
MLNADLREGKNSLFELSETELAAKATKYAKESKPADEPDDEYANWAVKDRKKGRPAGAKNVKKPSEPKPDKPKPSNSRRAGAVTVTKMSEHPEFSEQSKQFKLQELQKSIEATLNLPSEIEEVVVPKAVPVETVLEPVKVEVAIPEPVKVEEARGQEETWDDLLLELVRGIKVELPHYVNDFTDWVEPAPRVEKIFDVIYKLCHKDALVTILSKAFSYWLVELEVCNTLVDLTTLETYVEVKPVNVEQPATTSEQPAYSRQFMYMSFASPEYNLSEKEEALIQELYDKDCTDYEIAELLGLLRTDIEAWRLKQGFEHKGDDVERQVLIYKVGRTPLDEMRAAEMIAEGFKVKEIAAALNVSLSKVYAWKSSLPILIEKK